MILSPAWKGRKYAVLGLARTGRATVEALLAAGAEVTAWDSNEDAREAFAGRVTLADPVETDLTGFGAVLVTPGVPLNTHPIKPHADRFGVPVIGDIELRITGSGDLDMALEADDIEVDISGSGKVVLEGTGDELEIDITGSGDVRAFDLAVQEADVNISGSGDAEVRVANRLDVRISGSGDVFYKGQPEINDIITGSGDLIDAN